MTKKLSYSVVKGRPLLGMVVAAGALGTALVNTDQLVEHSFVQALSKEAQPSSPYRASGPAVAGSEEFWLGGELPEGAARVAWHGGVAIGDNITIGSGHTLKVVDIYELPAEASGLGKHAMSKHLVLVTCRDVTQPEAAPVRLVLDAATFTPRQIASNPAAL